MKSSFYISMIPILFIGVLSNQWPDGMNNNVLKSNTFNETNSFGWRLQDIQYDANTDDYFYLGIIVDMDNNWFNHFLAKFDTTNNQVWGKVSNRTHPSFNTLQYSSINQTLFYILCNAPIVLTKVNSSDGGYLNSFQIAGFNSHYFWRNKWSLSNNEDMLFWVVFKSSCEIGIVRHNILTSQNTLATIDSVQGFVGISLSAIDNTQVVFSYKAYSQSVHHIVKARYDESSNLLTEEYHQTI